MLRDMLTMKDFTVKRFYRSTDGMGGFSEVFSTYKIPYGIIWANGGSFNKRFLSEKLSMICSHVFVTEPALYTWDERDKEILYDGKTYKIMGMADDVMGYGEILVLGLELQE